MILAHLSRTSLIRYAVRSNSAYAVCRSLGSRDFVTTLPVQRVRGSRLFSDSSTGLFDRMKGSMEERNKRKQAEKYAEQLEKMANSESWTLKDFMGEIEEAIPTGWKSFVPGVNNTQQTKAAKETQQAIRGILDEVGEDTTVKDLENLGGKKKVGSCRINIVLFSRASSPH